MDRYLSVVSVVSIIIAAILSHLVTRRAIYMVSNLIDRKAHWLTTPTGSAVSFAVIFVIAWCAVSFIMIIPWLLVRSK